MLEDIFSTYRIKNPEVGFRNRTPTPFFRRGKASARNSLTYTVIRHEMNTAARRQRTPGMLLARSSTPREVK